MQVTPGTAQQPLSQMAQQFSMGAGKQQHNPYMYKYYLRNPRNIQIYLDISSNPEILNLDMCMCLIAGQGEENQGGHLAHGNYRLPSKVKKILICTNL